MADIHPHIERTRFYEHVPKLRESLVAADAAVLAAGFDPVLAELVRIRVAQINGCAFCVAYHLADARRRDVPGRKLDLLATWREAPDFDETERAALGWAEAVTRLGETPIPEGLYDRVVAVLGEGCLAQLTAVIALINAWTRIGAPLRFTPGR